MKAEKEAKLYWRRCLPPASFVLAVIAEIFALRVNLTVDTQSHSKLQTMALQSGYELHLENAPREQDAMILSYQGSAEHNHLVTLRMQSASLSKETQAMLPLPNLSNAIGKLLYAPDSAVPEPQAGKPCLISFFVHFASQAGAGERSVVLYPPTVDEFKQLDRMRTIHLRSGSPVSVEISANSEDGEPGPNCRNRVSIGNWEQVIGKDLQMGFIAAPHSEITLSISAKPEAGTHFLSGDRELESLELQPLHPFRLFVSPLRSNQPEQIRMRAGSPLMAVTNLQLGGDFLQVELSGLVGLPVSDLLGIWKWPLLVLLDIPLLFWIRRTFRFARGPLGPAMTVPIEPARIFLSYSWGDKERVLHLYRMLKAAGADPWIDRNELRGGEEWEQSIKRRMKSSERVIVFLSRESLARAGFVWAEMRMAVRVAEEQPEGRPFIIPVKLDECELPDILSRWNAIELYRPDGEARLLEALNLRHATAGTESARAQV